MDEILTTDLIFRICQTVYFYLQCCLQATYNPFLFFKLFFFPLKTKTPNNTEEAQLKIIQSQEYLLKLLRKCMEVPWKAIVIFLRILFEIFFFQVYLFSYYIQNDRDQYVTRVNYRTNKVRE